MKKFKFLFRVQIFIVENMQDRETVCNFIDSFSGVKSFSLSEDAILIKSNAENSYSNNKISYVSIFFSLSFIFTKATYSSLLNSVLEYVTTLELAIADSIIVRGILGSASQLKELIIHSHAYLSTRASTPAWDVALYRSPDTVSSCLVEHLRRIEFSIFSDKPHDILLIEYFLRHGKMLKRWYFLDCKA
ncbi:uncharacterized protein LOC111390857 [Olea europaea var. sylvestris]|uniref:uncharacterized protein LOC111390857 n=1 Tax=Olea europaea var. sylvestris TaxID=158386 RepID=UPI000C1CDDE2|nr:uncharacterized protein LOC111390857 [Olea europaea var. sylvestris]XP_022871752.1 uncharacterized protein LOC111390857 [Olea europaea var. sylvestris]XP_022871753.1 uncharacterized protein LOC111390857 [Olea europaea var. sylvestris]